MTVFQFGHDLKRVTDEQGERMLKDIEQNGGHADIPDGGLKALATLRLAQAVEEIAKMQSEFTTSIHEDLERVTDEQGERMLNKGHADISDGALEALATLRLAQAVEEIRKEVHFQNMR